MSTPYNVLHYNVLLQAVAETAQFENAFENHLIFSIFIRCTETGLWALQVLDPVL